MDRIAPFLYRSYALYGLCAWNTGSSFPAVCLFTTVLVVIKRTGPNLLQYFYFFHLAFDFTVVHALRVLHLFLNMGLRHGIVKRRCGLYCNEPCNASMIVVLQLIWITYLQSATYRFSSFKASLPPFMAPWLLLLLWQAGLGMIFLI